MNSATVVICAHNEEAYIGECLHSVRAQTQQAELVIVVADRCTDNTVPLAAKLLDGTNSIILKKDTAVWKNNISENLQLALDIVEGDAYVIVDADITLPPDFLQVLLPQLNEFEVVSSIVRTDPSRGLLNFLVALWEKTYAFAPLGEQPRGGARAISLKALRTVGGFRDVYAWESDLDQRLRQAGFKVKLDRTVSVVHRRRMTLSRSIAYQTQAGRARRELGVSRLRTILHSIVRLRPFVIVGYFRA